MFRANFCRAREDGAPGCPYPLSGGTVTTPAPKRRRNPCKGLKRRVCYNKKKRQKCRWNKAKKLCVKRKKTRKMSRKISRKISRKKRKID